MEIVQAREGASKKGDYSLATDLIIYGGTGFVAALVYGIANPIAGAIFGFTASYPNVTVDTKLNKEAKQIADIALEHLMRVGFGLLVAHAIGFTVTILSAILLYATQFLFVEAAIPAIKVVYAQFFNNKD